MTPRRTSRLPVKKLRRLLPKGEIFVRKGIRKNVISYYSPASKYYKKIESTKSFKATFPLVNKPGTTCIHFYVRRKR